MTDGKNTDATAAPIDTGTDTKPGRGFMWTVENLLKNPLALGNEMNSGSGARQTVVLIVSTAVLMACYGLVAGSFTGGRQMLFAAAKCSGGLLFTVLICFPSFYIFSSLGGADLNLKKAAGILSAAAALISMMLIGFAPVAWVFSQSTNSLGFMGFLHLAFFFIGLMFSLRLMVKLIKISSVDNAGFMFCWSVIFLITALQMMTALRPIIGSSDEFLPKDKMFFLQNWGKTISGK